MNIFDSVSEFLIGVAIGFGVVAIAWRAFSC